MRTIASLVKDYGFDEQSLRYIIRQGEVKPYQGKDGLYLDNEDADYLINMMTLPKLSDFVDKYHKRYQPCLLYTSPSPRDRTRSRMPSSA